MSSRQEAQQRNPRGPAALQRDGLRILRVFLVANASGRQEEQGNQLPVPHLRVMMRARAGTRPPSTLPALHAHNLRRALLVQQNNAVDLPVRMRMVLAAIRLLRPHIHGGNADEVALGRGRSDAAAAVFRAIQFSLRNPPVFESLKD